MRSSKYLPAIKNFRNQLVQKKGTIGERIMTSFFPGRAGWPASWSSDHSKQVLHFKNWTYVAIDTIASKMAQLIPNMAWVHNQHIPGVTQKYSHADYGWTGGTTHYDPSRTHGKVDTFSVRHKYTDQQSALPILAQAARRERIDYGGSPLLTAGSYYKKALSVVKPHEELEPLPADHLCRRLLENPNPIDTSFGLLYELDMFLELCGVAYLWVVPNGVGRPCEMWVLPSHWVWPRTGGIENRPNDPHADEFIDYYEIRPWGGMGSAGWLRFPPDEVIQIKWKSPITKIDGYSALDAASMWMDSEESITKSRWAQFSNQARPELWIELGPEYEDPDRQTINRVQADIAAKYAGELNTGKTMVTPPGAKVTPLSFTPTEMCYFQSEEQVRDMILSVFKVPKTAVGISNDMTYGSILSTITNLCVWSINPRLAMLGQVLTKGLGARFGRNLRIWYDDCSPADPAQVNADLQADAQFYAITPNEVRTLRGRKPYAHGGDDPIGTGPGGPTPIPMNTGRDFSALGSLYAQPPQPEQPGADAGGDMPPMAPEAGQEGEEQEQGPPQPGEEAPEQNDAGLEQPDDADEMAQQAIEDQQEPGIEEPNGKPSKSLAYRKALERLKNNLSVDQWLDDVPADEPYVVDAEANGHA